jgi:signal transduction histidine kinase
MGHRLWRLGSHAFDLTFFILFVYFTAGPSSPFFAFFVFSLVCATSRWQWRGTLWTAAVALTALFALGIYFGRVVHDPDYELHTFIIRAVYLAVIALLLGYLGAHEARTRREISVLASFSGSAFESEGELVEHLLAYSQQVLRTPRVVLAWSAEGRPHRVVECRREAGGEVACGRVPELEGRALEVEALRGEDFLCSDLEPPASTLLGTEHETPRRWRGAVLTAEAERTLGARSVLSYRLGGPRVSGRLLFLDRPGMTEDDIVLGAIVRRTVTAALDRHYLDERVKETVADEERVRMARDLHDGVLQSMTGFGLRLAAVRRRLADDPGAARLALDELQSLIALEQRDLRFFIQELHAPNPGELGGGGLRERLEDLADRIESEWGLQVELEIEAAAELSGRLGREVYHLVREGVVNAARHAGADRVRVVLTADGGGSRLGIKVSDDGRGFPFEGRFSGEELSAARQGPRSLRERIAALGGSLVLESDRKGSCLEIVLPASP